MLWQFTNSLFNPDYPAEEASSSEAIVRQANAVSDAIEDSYSHYESVQRGGEIYDAIFEMIRSQIESED
jgi:hypothetical protein